MPDDANTIALLEALKDIRNELRHHRTLLLESIDQGRMLERVMDGHLLALHQRMREVQEELEQTIKGELMLLIASLEIGGAGRLIEEPEAHALGVYAAGRNSGKKAAMAESIDETLPLEVLKEVRRELRDQCTPVL